MASNRFDVQLTREAEKDLKRLQAHTGRVTRAILKLEDDLFLGHPPHGKLEGHAPSSSRYQGVVSSVQSTW